MIVLSLRGGRVTCRRATKREICEAVYILVSTIPVGRVTSYGNIARALGINPRLVAWCLQNNRDLIVIPCHRVVHSSGELGGYRELGAHFKRLLLELEGVLFDFKGRVVRDFFIDIKM